LSFPLRERRDKDIDVFPELFQRELPGKYSCRSDMAGEDEVIYDDEGDEGEEEGDDEEELEKNEQESTQTHFVYGDQAAYTYKDTTLEGVSMYAALQRADWPSYVGFGDGVQLHNKGADGLAIAVAAIKRTKQPTSDGLGWKSCNSNSTFRLLVYTEDKVVKLEAPNKCTPIDEKNETEVLQELREEVEKEDAEYTGAMGAFNAVFVNQNQLQSKVTSLCVEGGAYDVMVADIGQVGEKAFEIRDATTGYWAGRLTGAKYLRVFGGQHHFGVEGRWFLARLLSKGIEKHEGGVVVGPFSNGYAKEFSGDVWRLELGPVLVRHEPHAKCQAGRATGHKRKNVGFKATADTEDQDTEDKNGAERGKRTAAEEAKVAAEIAKAVQKALAPQLARMAESKREEFSKPEMKVLVEAAVKKAMGDEPKKTAALESSLASSFKTQINPLLARITDVEAAISKLDTVGGEEMSALLGGLKAGLERDLHNLGLAQSAPGAESTPGPDPAHTDEKRRRVAFNDITNTPRITRPGSGHVNHPHTPSRSFPSLPNNEPLVRVIQERANRRAQRDRDELEDKLLLSSLNQHLLYASHQQSRMYNPYWNYMY
jgi:hypothetical protein